MSSEPVNGFETANSNDNNDNIDNSDIDSIDNNDIDNIDNIDNGSLNAEIARVLSEQYPSLDAANGQIVWSEYLMDLPRKTDLYVSDVHGEYEEFSYILRGACGGVKRVVDKVLSNLRDDERRSFVNTIIYPEQKIKADASSSDDTDRWYATLISRLVLVGRAMADTFSLEQLASAAPREFSKTITELFGRYCETELSEVSIAVAAIGEGCAYEFSVALCRTIQHLAVDHLYMLGDIYDRGPSPDLVVEEMAAFGDVDIMWGNHDILWMGASLGQPGCVCHVVRICARYGNLSVLEDNYGIDLQPLRDFALKAYADDPCAAFGLKDTTGLTSEQIDATVKIQKAMAIIQFKVEAHLIDQNPSFGLESRKLLGKVNFEKGAVVVDDVEYELTDKVFPTVDPNDPYKLTAEEQLVLEYLEDAFVKCQKLQKHISLLVKRGMLYQVHDNVLMFHACVPLNDDGSLKEVTLFGETYKGRQLFDAVQDYVYSAFDASDEKSAKRGRDLLWYLWLGEGSPLFAKSKMATFEIYYIADKAARKEVKNPFYRLYDDKGVLAGIFKDFGMTPKTSHIVCGHVPVKVKDGEDPVKADGRLLIIDGGMSRPYQKNTGIAGFTLVTNANGMYLYTHDPFLGIEAAIDTGAVLNSKVRAIEANDDPKLIRDCDAGNGIAFSENLLDTLVSAYQDGTVEQKAGTPWDGLDA